MDSRTAQRARIGTLPSAKVDRDVRAELGKNAAEVEATEARLNLLKAGARSEELELARTGVAKAEERVRYARIHLEMDETLVSEELVSKRQLEETKELHSLREKELQESRAQEWMNT